MSAVAEANYRRAVEHVTKTRDPSVLSVQEGAKIAYNGAVEFLDRMEAAGLVTAPDAQGRRQVIDPVPAP